MIFKDLKIFMEFSNFGIQIADFIKSRYRQASHNRYLFLELNQKTYSFINKKSCQIMTALFHRVYDIL